MENKNYLIVQDNVVTNTVVWNGDVNQWAPPNDAVMLIAEETPALDWQVTSDLSDYSLVTVMGGGRIGFIWDGLTLKTPEPKPEIITDSPDNPYLPQNQIPHKVV